MGNKNIPEIRFPGFSGEWEQMKLGEVVEIKDSARISNALWVSKGVPYLRSSDLSNDKIVGELFISDETYQSYKDKTGAPEKDDVLFTSGGKIGVTYHKIDDNPVYVQGGSILYAKTSTSNKLSGIYLKAFFSSPTMTKYIEGASTGLTIKHFTLKPANAAPIFISSLKEQNKIGEFFKQIDDTIALHQQELTTLKQTKQGFLQKMFPKEGESVPEVRFPRFTGNWEQRKLGEISEKVTEKNENNIYSETLTNSAEFGIINQRDFFDKDISNEKNLDGYYVVRPDDFVYNPRISNLAPVGPIKRNKLGRTGVMSPLYYVFRTHEVDKTYLEIYFSGNSWHRFMKLNGDSGARSDRFAIKDSLFREMPIPIPSIEEQNKIGNFFKQLDETITLHQRELDTLKETKKAFLQKMFV